MQIKFEKCAICNGRGTDYGETCIGCGGTGKEPADCPTCGHKIYSFETEPCGTDACPINDGHD